MNGPGPVFVSAEGSGESLLGDEPSPLQPLLERDRLPPSPRDAELPTMVFGELLALLDDGRRPLIRHGDAPAQETREARTCVDLGARDVGCQVALMYEQGDRRRPVVIGVLRDSAGSAGSAGNTAWPVEVHSEHGKLIVSAKDRLELRCGKASITLTAAGKILIEGNYLSSRSSGVNRIRGAAVQIN